MKTTAYMIPALGFAMFALTACNEGTTSIEKKSKGIEPQQPLIDITPMLAMEYGQLIKSLDEKTTTALNEDSIEWNAVENVTITFSKGALVVPDCPTGDPGMRSVAVIRITDAEGDILSHHSALESIGINREQWQTMQIDNATPRIPDNKFNPITESINTCYIAAPKSAAQKDARNHNLTYRIWVRESPLYWDIYIYEAERLPIDEIDDYFYKPY